MKTAEPAGGRIGIEDRPVLQARKKCRTEAMLQQLYVDRVNWSGHQSALHNSKAIDLLIVMPV
jgi:hypothetical protein